MVQHLEYSDLATRDRYVWAGVNSYKPKPVPSFDTEVLEPLRSEQARLAAEEAARAAEAAKAAQEQALALNTPQAQPKQATVAFNDAKAFIYAKESGNNPQARNSAGCLGLGQACPGSKLLAVCPTLDYACEDAFFTNYAIGRYGSWEAAAAFWVANRWW